MQKHGQTQKKQQLPRSGTIGPGCFFWCLTKFPPLLLCLFWCLCRLGDSDFTKHWQASKKNKPLDAPNLHKHEKKKTRKHNFHRLFMAYPQIIHGLSIDFPWTIHSLSMSLSIDYPQIIHGLSMCLFHRLSMSLSIDYPWIIHGLSMGYL